MTFEEFISIDPHEYGIGLTNILYEQSGSNSYVEGISLPNFSKNGVSLENVYIEVDTIKLTLDNIIVSLNIESRKKKSTHFTFKVERTLLPVDVTSYCGLYTGISISYREDDIGVNLIPFIDITFRTGARNPIIGNASNLRSSTLVRSIDKNSNQFTPTNLNSIISSSADYAYIPDSFYSSIGILRSRYEGSKLQTTMSAGNKPALSLRSFKGSIHLPDSNIGVLKTGSINKQEEKIYFNVLSPTGSFFGSETFPIVSSSLPNYIEEFNYLYREEGNNVVRIVDSKVLASEKGTVYSVNDKGLIYQEE